MDPPDVDGDDLGLVGVGGRRPSRRGSLETAAYLILGCGILAGVTAFAFALPYDKLDRIVRSDVNVTDTETAFQLEDASSESDKMVTEGSDDINWPLVGYSIA